MQSASGGDVAIEIGGIVRPEDDLAAIAAAFDTDRAGNFDIYVMNADGSGKTRLTNRPTKPDLPDWSPDGSKIVFDSPGGVYTINADGSDETRLTSGSEFSSIPGREPSWGR